MLLTEIISVDPDRLRDRLWDNKNRVGAGFFSVALQNRKDPNVITKVVRPSREYDSINDDPYYKFITKVVRAGNPYFPQIYEVKEIKTPYGSYGGFVVRMEKLVAISTLNYKLLDSIFYKMMGYHWEDVINQATEKQRKLGMDTKLPGTKVWIGITGPKALYEAIGTIVKKVVDSVMIVPIVDDELVEACNIVRRGIETSMFNDIRTDNMMVRMTKFGAQLVITDPVAPARYA